jgi:hypothetical protein
MTSGEFKELKIGNMVEITVHGKNKGKKGIRLSPFTEFKEGELVGDKHPSWKGGVQYCKNDVVYLNTAPNERVRRPRKIYEDTYGIIPKGYII